MAGARTSGSWRTPCGSSLCEAASDFAPSFLRPATRPAGARGEREGRPFGVALELFQTYLLVHDDLMDGDDVRRGGPSLPALMRSSFPGEQAEAMSVLAGDLAAAWAQRAAFETDLEPARVVLAARELARVHEHVVEGQILDVGGAPRDAREVEAMHALKTASYTVRGPVVIGARLAGARDAQIAALVGFADPLGVAFQLRDDVLGTFGEPGATGKPAGNDLREGKRTALVVDALRDAQAPRLSAACSAAGTPATPTCAPRSRDRGLRRTRPRRGAHRRAGARSRAKRSSGPSWRPPVGRCWRAPSRR